MNTIELENMMLHAEHDIRHARNNKAAFQFRATMSAGAEKAKNEAAAAMYAKDQAFHEKQLASMKALHENNAYHDLTKRKAEKDRAWAERLWNERQEVAA